MPPRNLERALALLGPLEARIMRVVWTAEVPSPFVVRDMREHMPELAYTSVMTTVHRLADKGILALEPGAGRQGHRYEAALTASEFLGASSERAAQAAVERFGDAALAAFAARLDRLSPERRERLRRLGRR